MQNPAAERTRKLGSLILSALLKIYHLIEDLAERLQGLVGLSHDLQEARP